MEKEKIRWTCVFEGYLDLDLLSLLLRYTNTGIVFTRLRILPQPPSTLFELSIVNCENRPGLLVRKKTQKVQITRTLSRNPSEHKAIILQHYKNAPQVQKEDHAVGIMMRELLALAVAAC
jgi:hypothetical protein